MNGVLRSHGVTLVELLLVLAIIGVVAVAATPFLTTSTSPYALDLAAEEIASVMRFARSEAMRLGEPRGFNQSSNGKRIRVYRPDTGTDPWTLNYDVYHPVTRQLYDVDFDLGKSPADVADITRSTTYRDSCDTPRKPYFDSNGTPWCPDPNNVLLEQFQVTLVLGKHTRVVTLQGVTGRVSIE